MKRKIYQTLENRNNPDEVEEAGPFKCRRETAWLGHGYYFWESFIDNAHWWGDECNNYPNGYIICEAEYDFDEDLCFNLIDNPKHIRMLYNAIGAMQRENLYTEGETTVARIIHYLRNTLKIFTYQATRVNGVKSRSKSSEYSRIAIFKVRAYDKYLDLIPTIQVCFYEKKVLNLRNYRIVYPDEYVEGYGV